LGLSLNLFEKIIFLTPQGMENRAFCFIFTEKWQILPATATKIRIFSKKTPLFQKKIVY
jgi:hypothetical protein